MHLISHTTSYEPDGAVNTYEVLHQNMHLTCTQHSTGRLWEADTAIITGEDERMLNTELDKALREDDLYSHTGPGRPL